MEHPPIRVLCIDDNDAIREAFRLRFSKSNELVCVDTLPSVERLLEMVEQSQPDVVLLDIDMPGRNPLAELAKLSRQFPRVRTIIVSGLFSEMLVDQAMEAGAWGYISKSSGVEHVINSIHQAMRGEFVLDSEISTRTA